MGVSKAKQSSYNSYQATQPRDKILTLPHLHGVLIENVTITGFFHSNPWGRNAQPRRFDARQTTYILAGKLDVSNSRWSNDVGDTKYCAVEDMDKGVADLTGAGSSCVAVKCDILMW